MSLRIVRVPDQTLRKKSKKITKIDKRLTKFIDQLKHTLKTASDPEGAGLSAPQVGKNIQIFATNELSKKKNIEIFINPKIIKHSPDMTLGSRNPDKPSLEGCLSIPNIWGIVPRHKWIELEYETLRKNNGTYELQKEQQKFEKLKARIIQHEIDHLHGILFTDHILKHQTRAFEEKNGEFYEMKDLQILETF